MDNGARIVSPIRRHLVEGSVHEGQVDAEIALGWNPCTVFEFSKTAAGHCAHCGSLFAGELDGCTPL